MLIAIPSESPGGIDVAISEHFGHCAAFTVVQIEDEKIIGVEVIENTVHEQGGCMAPVMLLKDKKVEALIAGGMGARPLAGFQQVGIDVYFKEDAVEVGQAVELFIAGKCREFGAAETCGGGEGHCGGHHQAVEREEIVGIKDIREGRVVTLHYELKTADGELVESSSAGGEMRYLHGMGMILPDLEKALDGLEEGAEKTVELTADEAFGQRDEARMIEVKRDQLPEEIKVGALVSAQDEQGRRIPLTVVSIDEDTALLDGNHMLAGQDLVFEITVAKVEQATPEELEHGHVH